MNLKHCIFLLFIFCVFRQADAKVTEQQTDAIDSLENLLNKELNDSLRIDALIEMATVLRINNVTRAIDYASQAKKLAEEKKPSLLNRVYFTLGNVYLNKADYKNALLYYLKALRIYEKQKKYEQASRCLNNIGVVHSYLKNNVLCEKYFREALAMREKYGFIKNIGIPYTSMGFVLSEKGEYAEALRYYSKALLSGRQEGDKYVMVIALINMGSVNIKQKKLAPARKYIEEALKINKELRDNEQQSVCYDYLSEIAVAEGNLKLAEKNQLLGLDYAQKAGIEGKKAHAYKYLAEIYSKQKNFEQAYKTRLIYEELNDSSLNENSYKQINELQASYDLERKNSEILLLNKDKELALTAASRQQLMRNILIAVCVFIMVIVFVLVRNVRLKKRLNQSLKTKNIELADENIAAKYEILKSKIDPHFLFNSLNTLSSIVHIDKDKAIEFIEQFSVLYRNILESGDVDLFHLSQEIKITNSYLYLQKVRFGDKLELDVKVNDTDDAFTPPFAIQMVVENAIKHNIISSVKKLHVSIYQKDAAIIIENNLQKKNPEGGSTGIGQKNIRDRYKMFTKSVPLFEQTNNTYRVSLPLIYDKTQSV
ncbi:MAG: tetratricopeptide repeat protein [Bacteroidota bacterium]